MAAPKSPLPAGPQASIGEKPVFERDEGQKKGLTGMGGTC